MITWLARIFFARLFEWFPDLQFEAHDIAASGPPWRMRLWVRYYDTASGHGVLPAVLCRVRRAYDR
jgi:hypothetical protein